LAADPQPSLWGKSQLRHDLTVIPSLSRRLVALLGLSAGCAAIFLADWPVSAMPNWVWKALAALSVLALLAMRNLPSSIVDDGELRRRVGDLPVNRLVNVRRATILGLFLAILPALFLAPPLPNLGARHVVLGACAVAVLCALAAFAFVEARFRRLVAMAGLVDF
jgi:hypothetical protein